MLPIERSIPYVGSMAWLYQHELKEARKRAGLTQLEAAERVGVRERTWGSWERGTHDPPIDKLRQIVETLNIPPALVGYEAPEGWELVPRDWLIKEFECLHAKLNQVDDCFKAMKKDAS